jgi:hypothetical protein
MALAGAPPASAAVPSKVTLNIKDGFKFKGRVSSSADECVVGRKVVLYRKEGGGDVTRVTHTFAAEDGRYKTEIPMQAGNKFYAKIKRIQTPPGTVCEGDRSVTKVA